MRKKNKRRQLKLKEEGGGGRKEIKRTCGFKFRQRCHLLLQHYYVWTKPSELMNETVQHFNVKFLHFLRRQAAFTSAVCVCAGEKTLHVDHHRWLW